MTTEALTNEQQVSTKFADIRVQLDDIAEKNAAMTFDYEDPKGNKEARSQVHKLRSLNGMIDKTHKVIKADVLEQGRLIDGVKKELKGRVAEMIALHHEPIKAIEDREAARVEAIEKAFKCLQCNTGENPSHKVALAEFNRLCEVKITKDVYQEREQEANDLLAVAVDTAQLRCIDAKKREDEQRELAELRKKTEEQERQLREQKIREEAAAKAKREADEAAQQRIDAANAETEAAKKRADEAEAEQKKVRDRQSRESEAVENDRQSRQEATEAVMRKFNRSFKKEYHELIVFVLEEWLDWTTDLQGNTLDSIENTAVMVFEEFKAKRGQGPNDGAIFQDSIEYQ